MENICCAYWWRDKEIKRGSVTFLHSVVKCYKESQSAVNLKMYGQIFQISSWGISKTLEMWAEGLLWNEQTRDTLSHMGGRKRGRWNWKWIFMYFWVKSCLCMARMPSSSWSWNVRGDYGGSGQRAKINDHLMGTGWKSQVKKILDKETLILKEEKE